MILLQRIWDDFRQGENIDLYITVIGSMVLAALNIFNIVPSSWITPLNLSILALISFALLGNRYRIETVLEKVAARNAVLLTQFPSDLIGDMDRAKELMILGVDLTNTLKIHYALLTEKLQKGDTVKILLVRPDSPACDIAAMLHYEPMTPSDKHAAIRRSLTLCNRLKRSTKGNLEVRLASHVPGFGAIVVNPDTPDGVLYLKYYPFKSPDSPRPKMVFRPKDGYWYEFFRREVISVWKNAITWDGSGEQ